jgi:hypothetical protein
MFLSLLPDQEEGLEGGTEISFNKQSCGLVNWIEMAQDRI